MFDFTKTTYDASYIKTALPKEYFKEMEENADKAKSVFIIYKEFEDFNSYGEPYKYWDSVKIKYLNDTEERLYFEHQSKKTHYAEIGNGSSCPFNTIEINPGQMYALIPFKNCNQKAAELLLAIYHHGIHHSIIEKHIAEIPYKIRVKALIQYCEKVKASANEVTAFSKYFQVKGAAISNYKIYVEMDA